MLGCCQPSSRCLQSQAHLAVRISFLQPETPPQGRMPVLTGSRLSQCFLLEPKELLLPASELWARLVCLTGRLRAGRLCVPGVHQPQESVCVSVHVSVGECASMCDYAPGVRV